MVVVAETYMVVVRRRYSHYCSRVVHQRMMGWIVVKFPPRRLRHDSFLSAVNTLTHVLEVSVVSNAYHDVHFCSTDHSD